MPDRTLDAIGKNILGDLYQSAVRHTPQLKPVEIGRITAVLPGIASVSGLSGIGSEELVRFKNGGSGLAYNLDEDEIGTILFCSHTQLQAGDEVERLGRVMDIAVGENLLGRVIDPLGRPLDGASIPSSRKRLPIERSAAAIMDRLPVSIPLQTGIKAIDAMIPVGRGQRELIIGDRKTGKTAIAIDAIIHQRDLNVLCVYCAISQQAAAVAKVIERLRAHNALAHTVVVVAESNDPPGLSYIAPYAATSIAEYFMEQGRDVLIVYDDLTQHARAYRELSLLLRRPPGREAFPGDVFYIHSRLLERSTHLKKELGGGSLTALPIVETEAQNISAYIPTNLISITDGQIYLSPTLFELGVLPAIDVGQSVSRVSGKAQPAAYRSIISDLKLAYAQYEELESFIRYGARLDEASHRAIEYGRRIQACLKQDETDPFSLEEQVLILSALTERQFDLIPVDKMPDAQTALRRAVSQIEPDLLAKLSGDKSLGEVDTMTIKRLTQETLARFLPAVRQGNE